MNNMVSKRELILFGAFLADTDGTYGIRERLTSADFVDNELAKCIEEIQGVINGSIQKEDMRFLPSFLESLKCPDGGKAIDGIEQAVKNYARFKQLKKVCLAGGLAKTEEEIELFKKQAQTI